MLSYSMGAWGVYDDENDNTADNWSIIQDSVLPKKIVEVSSLIIDIDGDLYQKLIQKHIFANIPKVYKQVMVLVNKIWKQSDKLQREKEADIAGIILYLVRIIEKYESSSLIDKIKKQSRQIPSELPKDMPTELAKSGEKAVLKMLEKLCSNKLGWVATSSIKLDIS